MKKTTRTILSACLFAAVLSTACTTTPVPVSTMQNLSARKDSLAKVISHKSIDELQTMIADFRTEGDSLGVAMAANLTGKRYYHNENDYLSSIESYRTAIPAIASLGDTVMLVETINLLSTNCRRIGAYSAASDYLFEALNIAGQWSGSLTDEGMMMRSSLLNGIGNVYKYLDNGTEAEHYFRRSIELDLKTGNNIGLAKNYATLGSVYEYRNEIDSARTMYLTALRYDEAAGSETGIAICHNKLGQLDMNEGKMAEALDHHRTAYEILKRKRDTWNLLKSGLSMAWIQIEQGKMAEASRLLDEAERLAAGKNSYSYLEEIYYDRAQMYGRQGRYREAFEQQSRCLVCRDSMAAQRNEQEVAQNRIRYEREQSEREINSLNLENERVEANRRMILAISIITGCVLVLLLFFAFMLITLQRRRNRELSEMNAIKNKFFSIISHDLKNPVLAQKQTLELLVDNFDRLPVATSHEQCVALLSSSKTLLELLYNLLAWSRLETGRMPFTPADFPLIDAVREMKEVIDMQAAAKDISIEVDVPDNAIAHADRNMVEMVLRNLAGNAVKFSASGSRVTVSATLQPKHWLVKVSDTGTGMSAEKVASLFSLEGHVPSTGTAGETGSGLGLIVSREMVERCGGRIRVESRETVGTTISFTLRKAE